MRVIALLVSTALVLSACANAAVNTPRVGKDELRKEQEYQKGQSSGKQKLDTEINAADRKMIEQLAVTLQESGGKVCEHLTQPGNSCRYHLNLITEPKEEAEIANAYADGNAIYITAGMVNMLDKEEELAFVLSHEYAHNILQHVGKKQINYTLGMLAGAALDAALASQGYNTQGQGTKLGASLGALSYSTDYEREADYVGLYIADHAGYDITRAADVWRKMGQNNPDSIYLASTHPTSAERYLAMQKVMEEIRQKKAQEQTVLPNRIEK